MTKLTIATMLLALGSVAVFMTFTVARAFLGWG
jgi:hypothetical protein